MYSVIGMMSGTSLDGLDIAHLIFQKNEQGWRFALKSAQTISYSGMWLERLRYNPGISVQSLLKLDHEYGDFLAGCCLDFIKNQNIRHSEVDLISSHGHTLLHNPAEGFTLQIGNGPEIYAGTKIKTICDYRPQDIALGGQGAPLVPVGDELLFRDCAACINLGGFANISLRKNGSRIAFDICPVNTVLNLLSNRLGKPFDEGGEIARNASVNKHLLDELNELRFYSSSPPKSLGMEWVDEYILPLLNNTSASVEELIATFTHHAAFQISQTINGQLSAEDKVLFSGGGTFNSFLLQLIRENTQVQNIIPDPRIINFREALIFAFLGVLRFRGDVNIFSSVTGSSQDHSSGKIYG